MREFLTICDSGYLPLALVLGGSLAESCPEFRLRILCMDAETYARVEQIAQDGVVPIDVARLEAADPGLAAVKAERGFKEYCWTAKPAALLHALEQEPGLEELAFLDADLMFWSDPAELSAEAGDASVIIHPHRFARRWRRRARWAGAYNSGFMSFRNDARGLEVLRWWRQRCLEWCYDRFEEGQFGDQRYLEQWPQRFPGVHVLEHPGAGLAPFNSAGHRLEGDATAPLVDGRPLVFYHHQSLSMRRDTRTGRRLLGRNGGVVPCPAPALLWRADPDYRLSARERAWLWDPYLRRVAGAVTALRRIDPAYGGAFPALRGRDRAREALQRASLRGYEAALGLAGRARAA